MVDFNNVQWGDSPRTPLDPDRSRNPHHDPRRFTRAATPVSDAPLAWSGAGKGVAEPLSRAALASLICSAVALPLLFLTGWAAFLSFIGAVLGVSTFRLLRSRSGDGTGVALGGAIVGWIGLVFGGGIVGFFLMFFAVAAAFVRFPDRR